MTMTYTSNLDKYEKKNIMAINYTGGVLTLIIKDWDTNEVYTLQYTPDSMPKSAQLNIIA